MSQKEAYQEKVEAQIREAEADIARLQAKAESAQVRSPPFDPQRKRARMA